MKPRRHSIEALDVGAVSPVEGEPDAMLAAVEEPRAAPVSRAGMPPGVTMIAGHCGRTECSECGRDVPHGESCPTCAPPLRPHGGANVG